MVPFQYGLKEERIENNPRDYSGELNIRRVELNRSELKKKPLMGLQK
ncbi:MAG: hypothetical protein AAFR66_20325 [Bacteroidota bacterium]